MVDQFEIILPAFKRGIHPIGQYIMKQISNLPQKGLVNIFIRHTSAGLIISENADPDVSRDIEKFLDKAAPENLPWYQHTIEGPDDMPAHIKSVITGQSITIPITNGKLNLGTWQGVFLCEFRNHASGRKLVITVYS
jgi:secondary thiamine-phosphate synthase enzyme